MSFEQLPRDVIILLGCNFTNNSLKAWVQTCKRHRDLCIFIVCKVPAMLHLAVSHACRNGNLLQCQSLAACAGMSMQWYDTYWTLCTRDDMFLWMLTQFQPSSDHLMSKITRTRNFELIKAICERVEDLAPMYMVGCIYLNDYEISSILIQHTKIDPHMIYATLTYAIEIDKCETVRAMLDDERYRTFIKQSFIPDWFPHRHANRRYHDMVVKVKYG